MKKLFAIASFVLISLTLSASHVHLSLTGVTSGTFFYYCSTTVDSVIVYKPAGAGVGDWYHSGLGSFSADNAIITPSTEGYWYFDDGTMIGFYVYFVSIAPTQPWTATDTTKCTESSIILKGQATNQPDFTYVWNTGSTASQINAVASGIYAVTVTGACGTVNDQINVLNHSVPTPNLGPDVAICDGNTVTLNPGTFAGYAWSTSVATSTIDVTTDGTYAVNVTDGNGCHASDTVDVSFLYPPDISICFVEFDSVTFKNRIQWATPPANAESINIYSEISTNNYSLIGTVPATQTSFIDMTSNPQNMSNSYKISVTDTCGNEGSKSDYHKTITLLSAYDQPTNTYGFTWSAYEGLTVANYLLFGITGSGQVMQIGSVPGNTYFYNYPNPSTLFVKYFVGFYTPACSGTKTDYIVRSNYVNSATVGIAEASATGFTIYPNPATNQITISGIESGGTIRLYDLAGKLLLERENRDNTLELGGIAAGSYLLEVSVSAEIGIIRKSLIIE